MAYSNLKDVLKTALDNFISQIQYEIKDGIIIFSEDVKDIIFFDGFIPDFTDGDFIDRVIRDNESTIQQKRDQLTDQYNTFVEDEKVITELLVDAGNCLLKQPLAVLIHLMQKIDLSCFSEDHYEATLIQLHYKVTLIQLMDAQKSVLLEIVDKNSLESLMNLCEKKINF